MDTWLNEIIKTAEGLFGRATMSETILVVVLSLCLGAWVLSVVSDRLGASRAFFGNSFFLTGVGLGLICVALSIPSVLGLSTVWLPLIAACATFLVLILPLTVLVQKSGYLAALATWVLTLLTVTAVLTAEPTAMRVFEKISDKAEYFGKHRVETEMYK